MQGGQSKKLFLLKLKSQNYIFTEHFFGNQIRLCELWYTMQVVWNHNTPRLYLEMIDRSAKKI